MASQKRWLIYPQNENLSQKLGQSLQLPSSIAQVLLNRNISSLQQARDFVKPSISDANFDIDRLTSACQLLKDKLSSKKKVMVLGDYDADGMTSTSLMTSVLKKLGYELSFFIPHRFEDGYGLNQKIAERCVQKKISLLITLDCGITNTKEIAYLRENGVDVLLLDHHTIPTPCPDANVILNPKFYEPEHPLYDLCTVGIVFKFLVAFCETYHPEYPIQLDLDLVAIGTVADVVNLRGENRGLVQEGLVLLNQRRRLGIRLLIEEAKLGQMDITGYHIGFVIGPILNAAGRLSTGQLGVDLLTSEHETSGRHLAKKLFSLNQKRKGLGQDILKEALEVVEASEDAPIIVMASANWHPGIIGITASQIARTFSKPTVLIGMGDDFGRGSARSIGEIDIYSLLNQCSSHFMKFGGHKAAAGFSIDLSKIDAFRDQLITLSKEQLSEKDLQDVLYIDAKLSPSEFELSFITDALKLSPFGQGNREPVFYSNDLKVVDSRLVGDGKHLKVSFISKDGKHPITAIGFGLSEKLELLYKQNIECVFNVDINYWNGQSIPQLKLIDIK
ncbi:single-stranded-DNA-specific exonuclease RecJ [bacterium]|jgi:single-stranded-DNA-specific exonuclease|nr:single-stranded-DNA-specific exonuclease RecJ [bacterium]